MLIPRIPYDPAVALNVDEPGSELSSFFLFGDAYLELSSEAAGCAPTAVAKDLLASKGGGVRVGPFVAHELHNGSLREAGLAAAAEWLHFGAASVVLDLGDSGLPDAAAVNTFGACLTDLWRNEQPRTRLVARISLDSKTAVSNQQDALINCLTALRPWVGAVQVVVPSTLVHEHCALHALTVLASSKGGGVLSSSSKGARGSDSSLDHLGLTLELPCTDSTESGKSDILIPNSGLDAGMVRVLHQSLVHVIAPAYLRTDPIANSAADGPVPSAPSLAPPSSTTVATTATTTTVNAGSSTAIAVVCAMASSGAAVLASLNAKNASGSSSSMKTSARVVAAVVAAGGGALAGLFVALALRPSQNNNSSSEDDGNGGSDGSSSRDDEVKAASQVAAAAAAVPPLVDVSSGKVEVVDAFLACLITDRLDGMFPTVVADARGLALGLVYSARASVRASALSGRGVYWSRSRGGLWRKGDLSGAWQALHKIEADCDADALRFTVTQHGDPAAFCHRNCYCCWGGPRKGLGHLECVLAGRRAAAPEGSYTKRLFEDSGLLRNKLVEEAQELAEAESFSDVAGEAADVAYFALVRCVAAGVGVKDLEDVLDRRAMHLKRRPGNAKDYRIAAGDSILQKKASP